MKIKCFLKSCSGRVHQMEYLIEGFPVNKPYTHFVALCYDTIPEPKKLIKEFRNEKIESLMSEISEHQYYLNPEDCEVTFENIDDTETYSNELLEFCDTLMNRSDDYKY